MVRVTILLFLVITIVVATVHAQAEQDEVDDMFSEQVQMVKRSPQQQRFTCRNCRCTSDGKRGWFTPKDCDYCCAARLHIQSGILRKKRGIGRKVRKMLRKLVFG